MNLGGCENVLIENNVIDLDTIYRILFSKNSKVVERFNNTTSAGTLILGLNGDSGKTTEELATRIADSLLAAL